MKPIWKWVISIVVLVLVLLAVGVWYLNRYWKPKLESQLQSLVQSSSDSLYSIAYDDLQLNILRGNIRLKNAMLHSDSLVYSQLIQTGNEPINRLDLAVADLEIRNFHVWHALFSNRLKVGSIRADSPKVVLYNRGKRQQQPSAQATSDSTKNLSGPFKSIALDDVELQNVELTYIQNRDTNTYTHHFENVRVSIKDVRIDPEVINDSTQFLFARSIDLRMGEFLYEIPDSFYDLGFKRLRLRTEDHSLFVEGFHYAPRIDRNTYYQELQVAKAIVRLHFDEIRLNNLDLFQLFNDQAIRAKTLQLAGGLVDISNDYRYPKRHINRIGRSPHQQLMNINVPIQIDSVHVDSVDIRYAEISKKHEQEGVVTFERTKGWLAPVTNDTLILQQNPSVKADMISYLMGQGRLNALFDFDMLDTHGGFTYKGTLGSMDGRSMNRIITPLLSAEVESVTIQGLRYDMQGNDHQYWGSLWFDYEDLRLNLLRMNDDAETSKRRVVSFLANELLINSSNPDGNDTYHIGTIDYQRIPEYTFFKTLWKSLLEGIKQSVGVSKEQEERLSKTTNTVQTIKEKADEIFDGIFQKRTPNE